MSGSDISVLIEFARTSPGASFTSLARAQDPQLLAQLGIRLDASFGLKTLGRSRLERGSFETMVIRATAPPGAKHAFRVLMQRVPQILNVWSDPKISFLSGGGGATVSNDDEIIKALGADQVWQETGILGGGSVIGIVDYGVEPSRVRQTWPPNLAGTPVGNEHGNASAHHALLPAPEAELYDYRISFGSGVETWLSDVFLAYDAALDSFRNSGKPQVLSNSWAIPQRSDDPFANDPGQRYVDNPNHPLMVKALELIDSGVQIVFAAGNCGSAASGAYCGPDRGPCKSILGLNGHGRVIVGSPGTELEFAL